ncbi:MULTISPECIES: UbiA prenyltransferase family protein [unclassified Streptomyces]|uniref:UbiA prenyltransferase family protein n=1 Tax=unclassified Streptomyces TaxID=2593676 RepID=UPI0038137346
MTARLRLLVLLSRPPVALLLALYTAVGLGRAGHGQDPALLAGSLVAVLGFLLFSVACNDLADVAIDRVNLPGAAGRPLVTGSAARRDMVVVAATSGVLALGTSLALDPWAGAVTAAGLAVSAGYSLRPVRLADRGAVAALVLPACYVAVPYLVGVLAARPFVRPDDLLLLAGLYIGFIGRILLKDFRDVRGDALFGKRTFLVRHGRRATCLFSACCWVAGTAVLIAAARPGPAYAVSTGLCLAGALWLLRALATGPGHRREEALISAIAIVGRGMVLLLLAHLSMLQAHWTVLGESAALAALLVVTAGQAATMAVSGPVTRLTVPFSEAKAGAGSSARRPA